MRVATNNSSICIAAKASSHNVDASSDICRPFCRQSPGLCISASGGTAKSSISHMCACEQQLSHLIGFYMDLRHYVGSLTGARGALEYIAIALCLGQL
jgi:hypothetical protein